jgi:hypothetical protein
MKAVKSKEFAALLESMREYYRIPVLQLIKPNIRTIAEQLKYFKQTGNQCDGCQAGYPVNANGNHLVPYPSGSMWCEKDRYK